MALIPAGIAMVLVIMGITFWLVGRHESRKDAAMLAWPSTTATITDCGLVTFRRPNDTREQQNLETAYEYTVAGRTYRFTQVEWVGYGTTGHEGAVRHTANEVVPVYFDPDNPEDASLTRERPASTTPFFVLAIGLAVLSAPFWFLALRMARTRKATAPL